jgi:hypothetical protein
VSRKCPKIVATPNPGLAFLSVRSDVSYAHA